VFRALAALALASLALAGCGSSEDAAAPASAPGDGTLAGTTLDGEAVSLEDFRGTPVLVNVWSSW
jgi:ABC-type glycerol-3-phosphate transport system substrate-binding protein